jgi:hypothetical protein
MRATRGVGFVAGIIALSGCVYGYQSVSVGSNYSSSRRPDPTYYCYDCHGYRYFDPYYDWCTGYGFRYRWDRHPRAVSVYRKRYLGLRRENRDFGRYSYPEDYRVRPRYREPRDYESWKLEERRQDDEADRSIERRKSREREPRDGRRKREKRPEDRPPRESGWRLGTF